MAKDRSSDTWGKVKYQAHMAGLRLANALRDLGIRLPPRAQLVYHPDYVLPVKTASARHAFDTHRGGRVVERMREVGVLGEGMLLTPEPISAQELELVHAPEYLADISRPERLAELLFVSFDALAGQDPMRSFLLQAGGTLLAAREALEGGGPVFNLGGGFHHAQRDRAEGLCPINDVAVAIRALQQQGKLRRALVVDLDYHQGNGTALIFGDDERVFTLSVHGQSWSQVEQKENTLDVELSAGVTDGPYLEAVARSLDDALGRFEPELAIYLAGVDVHRRDDLGDFAISEKGLLDRDLMVLERLDQAGVPVAVTLAGGYWPMAWSAAYNMIYSSLTGVRIHRSQRPSNIRGYFRRRRRELDPALLSAGAPELTEETLEDLLVHKGGSGLYKSADSGGHWKLFANTGVGEGYGALVLLVYHVQVLPPVEAGHAAAGRPRSALETAFNFPWGRITTWREWDVGTGLGSVHQLETLAASLDADSEAPDPRIRRHPFWNKRLRQVPWLAGIMLLLFGAAWTRPSERLLRCLAVPLRPLLLTGRYALRV